MNFRLLFAALAGAFLSCVGPLPAQVPQIISYQGRVLVGSTNYVGVGTFRFALVNPAGTTTYWSNDGTSVAGSQPAAGVSLSVNGGLYSVLLGDIGMVNMTAIPNSVFANADVRLRVWFNDGTNGSQLLTPDQRIASVGYAMIASGVPNGAITAPMLANGAAAANLSGSGQSGVPSGGIVFSPTDLNSSLTAVGYIRIGALPIPETWVQRAVAPIAGRFQHTTVWTGSEMIVWGGNASAVSANDGARFNPATGSWTPTATTGAPVGRDKHSAVWTGTEMIVWGGNGGFNNLNTGGRYNPTSNTWTAVTTTGAPAARSSHTASWTGAEMVVWGGVDSVNLNDGARYNPSTNSWASLAAIGAPSARYGHTAVWTGTEMIVWGGTPGGFAKLNTGGRYNAAGNSWAPVSTTGAPFARDTHTAVWTGSEMIIWGGRGGNQFGITATNTGGRYSPAFDTWTTLNPSGAPGGRYDHSAVWTGSEMIVWGGYTDETGAFLNDGSRFSLSGNSWTALNASNPPAARSQHTAVWTGREMLLFGGRDASLSFNDSPGLINTLFLYQRP